MQKNKTVWVNLDPAKVGLVKLAERCALKGYTLIAKEAGNKLEDYLPKAKHADAIVSIGEIWNEETLAQISGQNKIIVRYGAGVDNVNIPTATKYKIPVANLPGQNAPAVAEVALLHILNMGRHFTQSVDAVKNGKWASDNPGNELNGKTVGLIGFGNIARQLARMLKGFSVNIIAYDAFLNDAGQTFAQEHGVKVLPSSDDVFKTADYISLHIPFNKNTENSIGAAQFSQMKPSAYFINTCRGGVVREKELIEALQAGKIRGAGLDVLQPEPPIMDNPLLHMDNVTITSHIGALAIESEERSQLLIADIIDSFFEGIIHQNILNREALQ